MDQAKSKNRPSFAEQRLRLLFENMLDGLAYCKMLFDEKDNPIDFVYLEVNPAFEKITGLKDVERKLVSEVFPGIRQEYPELFDAYGRVAKTRTPERFEINFKPLSMTLDVSVYSPEKGYFVAVFEDVSQRKIFEAELEKRNVELEQFNEMAINRELKMVEMKKRILELENQLGLVPSDNDI